jgi:hypothetical protein
MKKKISRLILPLLLLLLITGCEKEKSDEGNLYVLKLHFQITANNEPLKTDQTYVNTLGEDFKISLFKMYVSHVGLLQDGPDPVAENRQGVYLLDTGNEATQSIEVPFDNIPFSRIVFQVGIDSIWNVSGAQSGVLDPANGMFWTWNSGYIMAKLEGVSSFSNQVNNSFTYHIGGYKGEEKTQRRIVLPLPVQGNWMLEKNSTTEITVRINLDKWFDGVHQLSIQSNPVNMTPGALAVKFADNYATLFSVTSITRQP